MPGYHLVTVAYPDARKYQQAILIDSVRWSGDEVDGGVVEFCNSALQMLTSPLAQLGLTDEQLTVTNGRGRGIVLDCTASLT